MGESLWRMFKKYGTVYDMFMVNKRLRNGKRYGFVRFKNVVENEMLYKALETIWIDKYKLRVFKAEDRKDMDEKVDGSKGENGRYGGDYNIKKGFNQYERNSEQDGCKQQEEVTMNKSERLIEMEGMENVIVKYVGGLDIMLEFENSETLHNIMMNIDHGIRQWLENVRNGVDYNKCVGRLTWLNIIGVPVAWWSDALFRRIAMRWGTIMETENCSLEEVRDSVEVEMEEEVCSDSDDGDMDDLMEDGECDREGGEADQSFPETDGDMTNKEWVSNDEVKLAEESQNEVLGHPQCASNKEDCNERAGDDINQVDSSVRVSPNNNKDQFTGKNIPDQVLEHTCNFEGDGVGDDRHRKKRKTTEDGGFTTVTCADGRRTRGIVKRRSFHVAKAVARMRKKVAEINGNLNGVGSVNSDEYKVTHVESSGVGREDKGSTKVSSQTSGESVNSDRVCEIGKMIGVVWEMKRGIATTGKCEWIQKICRKEEPYVLALQETKCRHQIDEQWIEDGWGLRNFGYVQVEAKGRSGGLLLVWDSNLFFMKQAAGNDNYSAIKGNWKGKAGDVAFVNVYGPYPTSKKGELWNKLEDMINLFKAAWCVFGDFNEVREQDDRLNTQFQAREDEFNEFIVNTHLIEMLLGGRRFTRISDDGMKFNNLDRYLVSDEFKLLWGSLAAVALDRKLSDHCPIALKDIDVNFGPKPFRALDIWLEESDIDRIALKKWSKTRFGGLDKKIEDYSKEAMRWELEAEKRSLGDVERTAWMDARRKWIETDKEKAGILKQKSRMKWDIEGDENSKFSKKEEDRPSFCNGRVTMLLDGEATSLENTFTKKEIWNAVCGCGSEKAPGPDGFNFQFIKKFWDGVLIANETVGYIKKARKKCLLFKVDFEKAYDSLNWDFLLEVLKIIGFGSKWCKWVEACLASASISVLVNGSPTKEFNIGRGVRQGDPLYPFLFILAAEGHNVIMQDAMDEGLYKGVGVGNDAVNISHLQYADDTLYFANWSKHNAKNLMCILKGFEKSKVYGIGVSSSAVAEMARVMKCSMGELPLTYMGLPVGVSMRRESAWRPVVEKFKKRLTDWKAKTMSFGGRLTLVKSVLGSVPLYYFSMFRVPSCVIKQLERVRRDFFWGGLGRALIGKWWWRYRVDHDALWCRVVRSIHGADGGMGEWGWGYGGEHKFRDRFPRLYYLEGCKEAKIIDRGRDTWKWSLAKNGIFSVKVLSALVDEKYLDNGGNGNTTLLNKIVPKKINVFVWESFSWKVNVRCRVDRNGALCFNYLVEGEGELEELESTLHNIIIDSSCRDTWKWSLAKNGIFSVKVLSALVDEKYLDNGGNGNTTLLNKIVPKKINVFVCRALRGRLHVRVELDKKGIDIPNILCPICDETVETTDHALVLCNKSENMVQNF
ncbi:putative RNA-directed DNA polymerase, eukaryota, reverse transcriptase zinc-binding domain protein [Tanacetum coccineum]